MSPKTLPKAFALACLSALALVGAAQAQAAAGVRVQGVSFSPNSGKSFSAFGQTIIGNPAFGGPSVYSPFGALNAVGGYGDRGPTFRLSPVRPAPARWDGKPLSVEKTRHGKTFHFGAFKWDENGNGHSVPAGARDAALQPDGGSYGDDDAPALPAPADLAMLILGVGRAGQSRRRAGRGNPARPN